MIINGERDTLFRFEELTFLADAHDAASLRPTAGQLLTTRPGGSAVTQDGQ